MAQTTNLKLPLIDASMTADIPRDMNALAQAVDTSVTSALAGVTVPDATTTRKGIVQLNDNVNSTSKTQAATADALRRVYEEALAGKQLGVEQKNNVVAALNSIGVTATTSEGWPQLIAKISGVVRATGSATAAQVLAGATFSNAGANGLTGTMPNRGAGGTITPGRTNQTKDAGYYSSAITIAGDPDLVADNLPKDVNIFNIQGVLERMTTAERNAIISAIVSKGVSASSSDSNAVLANKISQIKTGKSFASGTFNGLSSAPTQIRNLAFDPTTVVLHSFNAGGGTMIIRSDLSGSIFNATARNQTPGWFNNNAVTIVSGGFDVVFGSGGLFYWFALNTN